MLTDETLHLPGETPPPHTPADVDAETEETCPVCGDPENWCATLADTVGVPYERFRACPYRDEPEDVINDDEFDHIAWAKEVRGRQQQGPR